METANEVSEKMARLFEKLAFETCHGEMQDAFRFEGPGALETARSMLARATRPG